MVFLAVCFSFLIVFGADAEKVTIAVFDFEALGVDNASALTISDLMRTELTGIGTWDLVEREKLTRILKELELQRTGLTQIDKAREIGRILNAEKLVLGSVGKLGSMYVVQARLVDVETGKTDLAKKVTCNCPLDEILPAIENLARQVAGVSTEETIVSAGPRTAAKEADLSKMVHIQGGAFRIGLNELGYKILSTLNPYVTRESFSSIMPAADVFVDEFHIDRYEVTNSEFKEFCDHTGKPYPPDPGWGGRYANYFISFPEHPVVNVTWYEAMDFAKWQGKSLPTEAQWELASRLTTQNLWVWGNKWEENKANLAEQDQYPFTSAGGAFLDDSTPSRDAFQEPQRAGNGRREIC
jgi:formylglycine-generating enzyme required for sulfatase activity